MTQEEKAKAYDEALKRAKATIDIAADKDLVGGVVRTIFPELKESEDERIIVRLIEYFQGFLEGYEDCYKDGGCVKWEDLDVKSILAWLEKQKDERELGYIEGKVEGVRQTCQEIKDAMSLFEPKDLTPFEFTFRDYIDSAIRYCLSGEGYQQYIKEWSADLLNLEKQKEHPKSADSIPPDCTSDAKCEDRWHKVEDSLPDNGRLVLANDCLGNTLLARYDGEGNWEVSVYDNNDYYCRNTITKWCEIPSEKQKEHAPIPDKFSGLKSLMLQYLQSAANRKDDAEIEDDTDLWGRKILDYVWKHTDMQKEQKPAEYLSKDKVYAIMNQLTELSTSELIPLNSNEYKKINEITSDVRRLLDYPIGQKPVDYAEELKKCKDNPLYFYDKYVKVKQKPAEWSEEDERKLQRCIEIVESWEGDYDIAYTPYSNFLKSLRPSWKPSEEQMKALCSKLPVIRGRGDKVQDILQTLYDDLKKLM